MFAADTAGLMQALGIEHAHIAGASLGGLVAQEFALTRPQMLDKMVLAATAPKRPSPRLRDLFSILKTMRRTGDPATDIRKSFELFTTPEWFAANDDVVQQYVDWRVSHPQPPYAYNRQQEATKTFNAEDRVGQIKAPTLILHGTEDRVVPVSYGKWLEQHIPGSQLALIRAGHAVNIEQYEWFNSKIVDFLNN
ncbi:MAG: alpha/beta fold hydrolase [Chloroflexota bacterium]